MESREVMSEGGCVVSAIRAENGEEHLKRVIPTEREGSGGMGGAYDVARVSLDQPSNSLRCAPPAPSRSLAHARDDKPCLVSSVRGPCALPSKDDLCLRS